MANFAMPVIAKNSIEAYAMLNKEDELGFKAKAVDRGIAAAGPEKLDELRVKLVNSRVAHNLMVGANKAIRRYRGDDAATLAAIMETGMLESNARTLLTPDFMGRRGFPVYAVIKSKASIFKIEQRIREIEESMWAADLTLELSSGAIYRESVALNRVMLCFEYKPEDDARAILKQHGFRWAPTNETWQRQLNSAGRSAAQSIIRALELDDGSSFGDELAVQGSVS